MLIFSPAAVKPLHLSVVMPPVYCVYSLFVNKNKMDEAQHYKLLQREKEYQDDISDCEKDTAEEESLSQRRLSRYGWQCSTFTLLVIATIQFFLLLPSTYTLFHFKGPYETGFTTDFYDAKPHISLEQRQFSSGLRVSDNGTVYRAEGKSGEAAYVGRDLEAVDKAWDELFGRRYFVLHDEEVAQFDREEPSLPALEPLVGIQSHTGHSGVFGGVEVLHSLHCLDALRRYINGQAHHHGRSFEEGGMRIHIGNFSLTLDFQHGFNCRHSALRAKL